jgi:hypothetical protein
VAYPIPIIVVLFSLPKLQTELSAGFILASPRERLLDSATAIDTDNV